MQAVLCSDTRENFNQTTRRHTPEDSIIHSQTRENLISVSMQRNPNIADNQKVSAKGQGYV
jgi:hypothetical protein